MHSHPQPFTTLLPVMFTTQQDAQALQLRISWSFKNLLVKQLLLYWTRRPSCFQCLADHGCLHMVFSRTYIHATSCAGAIWRQ